MDHIFCLIEKGVEQEYYEELKNGLMLILLQILMMTTALGLRKWLRLMSGLNVVEVMIILMGHQVHREVSSRALERQRIHTVMYVITCSNVHVRILSSILPYLKKGTSL